MILRMYWIDYTIHMQRKATEWYLLLRILRVQNIQTNVCGEKFPQKERKTGQIQGGNGTAGQEG